MGKFKENLSNLFSFKGFVQGIKDYFKFLKTRKFVTLSLSLSLVFMSLLMTSSVAIGEFMPSSKAQTVAELVTEYMDKEGDRPRGLIYPKLLSTSDSMVYNNPEKVIELRSLYTGTYFDLYPANFMDRYTPGVVEYLEESDVHVSFLLWPKWSYDTGFRYSMPLLAGNTPAASVTNAIYINKSFAQKLLTDYEQSITNYKYLIDKDVVIPYEFKTLPNDEGVITTRTANMTYVIKGVINSDHDKYKEQAEYYGDFFIASEYLSLPLLSATSITFDIREYINRKFLDTVLDIFSYETLRNGVNTDENGLHTLMFDYRVGLIGKTDAIDNYSTINTENESLYNKKMNKAFDVFAHKKNIVYTLEFIALNAMFFIAQLVFVIISIKSLNKKDATKKEYVFMYMTFIVFALLSCALGLQLFIYAGKYISLLTVLSRKNYVIEIIYLVETIVLALPIIFVRKKGIKR